MKKREKKIKFLFILEKGVFIFFNQTGDDGGEQIKLKVIKASVH